MKSPGAKGRVIVRTLKHGFLAAAASVLLAGAAHAVPQDFVAIPPSSFNVSFDWGVFGTATGSGAITGTAATDLTVTPTNVSTVDGSGNFSGANLSAPGLSTGPMLFDNFHISLSLPATTSTNGSNPFNPDIGGAVVSVDDGQVLTGSSGEYTLFDFSKTPLVVTAPAGSLTTFDGIAGTWTIPFTETTTGEFIGIPNNITIGTDLVLQTVPEPGTLLLLGVGLAGLAALKARRHRV